MSWGKPLKYLHKSQGNITSTERKKQKTRNNILVHPIRHFKSLVIRGLPISNVLAVWLFYMLYHLTCTSWMTEFLRNGTSCSAPHSVLLRNTIGDKCTVADFNDISIKVMLDITSVHSPVFFNIRSPVDIPNIRDLLYH